jgi:predicted nuclease of predicted toxin-antitoxin system
MRVLVDAQLPPAIFGWLAGSEYGAPAQKASGGGGG